MVDSKFHNFYEDDGKEDFVVAKQREPPLGFSKSQDNNNNNNNEP
jgi:hypothetical protein